MAYGDHPKAWLNKCPSSRRLNWLMVVYVAVLTMTGRLFHIVGAAARKARAAVGLQLADFRGAAN